MRDEWYADKKDLVKWGVILALAERFGVKHILQILYYRETEWPSIEVDGEVVNIHPAVVRHFRDVTGIQSLQAGVPISVFAEPFGDRSEYHRKAVRAIADRAPGPGIVFLDPDTGLEPNRPSLAHVLNQELFDIWSELSAGDVIVFYQHQTNRSNQPWVEAKRAQFANALKIPVEDAKLARAEAIARDVAFFFAQKAG